MRAALVLAAFAAPLALGACAAGAGTSTYQTDLDKLEADCKARDGILMPTGASTGRPQTDNVCRINGGATRIPR
ncbi:hypothetical protein [Brevundimonas sp. CEF1]|uniref:hypothetical protein n=1 Tax=Brevundimonas sp. CEF1 TaxID=3442642 RepID=UPI003F519259